MAVAVHETSGRETVEALVRWFNRAGVEVEEYRVAIRSRWSERMRLPMSDEKIRMNDRRATGHNLGDALSVHKK